jgi:hypothetical protein
MPIESYPVPEHNMAVFVHTGRVPDEEFMSFYKSFFESDTFDPPMKILVDLRETSSSTRSPETLLNFAEVAKGKLADIESSTKVAVVAPKDLSFGLARLYEILSDSVNWSFVVFRSMDAASAWLGLPEDPTIRPGEKSVSKR